MIAIVAVLIAVATASFIYLLMDAVLGRNMQESTTIQRRLSRILVPDHPTITRGDVHVGAIWSVDQVFRRQQMIKNLSDLLIFSGWTMPLTVFVFGDLAWAAIVFLFFHVITKVAWIALGISIIAGFIPYWILVLNKSRYMEKFTLLMPDALMMMKNALRAGQGVQAALQMVADEAPQPVSGEFQRVVKEIELGSHIGEALNALSERIQTRDVRMFVLGIFIQQEIGGNLAELFESIEATIRDRITLQRELRTLSAQGKMSGLVLVLLPPIVALALGVINPGYFEPLITNAAGKQVLGVAIGLQAIGTLCVRKITTINITA